MTKYIALTMLFFFAVACGEGAPEPVDLTGSWVTTDDASVVMTAAVSNGEIEIVWVDEAESISALYWVGTVPDEVTSGDIFVSEADRNALDTSLLGSQSETKAFTYADGTLSYDLTVMGVTQTITLERVS